jgi:hypothetical protein
VIHAEPYANTTARCVEAGANYTLKRRGKASDGEPSDGEPSDGEQWLVVNDEEAMIVRAHAINH